MLFKCVLIQHLYGIFSLRRAMAEIDMNIAYRWFLGYAGNDELPHFSAISYNFRNRFNEESIEKVFRWILWKANQVGYLTPSNWVKLTFAAMNLKKLASWKWRDRDPLRFLSFAFSFPFPLNKQEPCFLAP